MNAFDIVILACLLFFLIVGFAKGFIRELFDLLSLLAAFLVAVNQMSTLVSLLGRALNWPTSVLTVISFVILFAVCYVVVMLAGRVLSKLVRVIFLGWLDRLGGSVFGLFKGILLVSILTYLFALIPWPTAVFKVYDHSKLVPPFASVAPCIFNGCSRILPGVKSFYQEFSQSLTNNFSLDLPRVMERQEVRRFFESFESRTP